MKKFLKLYLLPAFILIAFSATTTAQSKRKIRNKAVVVKTRGNTIRKKSIPTKRIINTKITYRKPTKKIVSVRKLPNRVVIKHGGKNYYYANNKYYTQSRGRYIVIAPKIGFRIHKLPLHYTNVIFNHRKYYNAQGVFYIQINDEYEVVEPEIGTIIYELPDNYEKVTLNGQKYYEYANVLYQKTVFNGTKAYKVVGIVDMI